MSWSINIIGKTADVNAAIQADSCLPQLLKNVVALFTAAGTGPNSYFPPAEAIQVITSGHYDENSGGSNIYTFSINPVTLASPAPADPQVVSTDPAVDQASQPCDQGATVEAAPAAEAPAPGPTPSAAPDATPPAAPPS